MELERNWLASQRLAALPFLRGLQSGALSWYHFWRCLGRYPTAEECREFGLNDPNSPQYNPTSPAQDVPEPTELDLPPVRLPRFARFWPVPHIFLFQPQVPRARRTRTAPIAQRIRVRCPDCIGLPRYYDFLIPAMRRPGCPRCNDEGVVDAE